MPESAMMITSRHPEPRRRRANHRGFTLLETALAIIIVGVGVLAIVSAQQAFHRKNSWSTHASTATWLANEIRELTLNMPRHDPVTGNATWGPEGNEVSVEDFDDLDDFDGELGEGTVFSADLDNGPINARREIIPNMPGWSQTVRVYNVDPNNITAPPSELLDGQTSMMIVEVTVSYQAPNEVDPMEMIRMRWVSPR